MKIASSIHKCIKPKVEGRRTRPRRARDRSRITRTTGSRWFLRGGAPREILPEKAISNPNFELELTLRQLPFRDDENVRSVPHPTKHSHAARADPRPPE